MIRVAWYRTRATFGRGWSGLLALVLLIGLVGGLAMGVIAGARRTQSSFPAFLASTNPSDLGFVGISGQSDLVGKIAHLPHIKQARNFALLNAGPIRPDGSPTKAALGGISLGSIDGLGFDQDRLTATQGRLADPKRADEVMLSGGTGYPGVHLGDVVEVGVFTGKQTELPGFGTARVQPKRRLDVTVVGLVKFNNEIVQDDIDANGQRDLIFTPAFSRDLVSCCSFGLYGGYQLDRGARAVPRVEGEIEGALPPDTPYYVHVTAVFEAQAERAIKPESIALGVFGAITGLALLLIAGQVIGRRLRSGADDLDVLRALGASPTTTMADGLIGVITAVVTGSLLAVVVAASLSPLAPIGAARSVYPSVGIAFDWTVLGAGLAILVVGLSAIAVATAYRQAPGRIARRRRPNASRPSNVARAAAGSGLPVASVTGVRFALESGRSRNAAPVRSAMLGAALAIVVVTGTLTFGASLRTLVSHPALYGWNWDLEMVTQNGGGNIPDAAATRVLSGDSDVASWSGFYFDSIRLDGQTVPILGGRPGARIEPPLLSGHALEASNQVVLGATTLAQLHKHVGDTVEASYGSSTPTPVRIVGTATMPAVGPASQLHLSMGTGALVDYKRIPASVLGVNGDNSFAPNAYFVRLRPGADPVAARQALKRTVAKLGDGNLSVLSVQRPAEIVNYRSMGTIPALLGTALAVGAVVALALTLVASVRRRRRELALLKTLGFTHRQLAAVVAWQSSVAVAIGTVIGMPIGIVVGRGLWYLFAHELHVVPEATVPALTLLFVAVAALVLANLVAAIPGRQAARTPTALVLSSE